MPIGLKDGADGLREVLLRPGGPFTGASDIGEEIAQLPGTGFPNSKSSGGYIAQVLRGEKNCSDTMRDAIIAATLHRLGSEKLTDQEKALWRARVSSAVKAANDSRRRELTRRVGLSSDFLIASARSLNRFAIGLFTHEMRKTEIGRKLIRRIIVPLGVAPKPILPELYFTICFPDELDATGFWRDLLRAAVASAPEFRDAPDGIREAAKQLRQIEESNHLRVFTIPYYLCLTPVVLYDLDRGDSASGFILLNDASDLTDRKLEDATVRQWVRFYDEFQKKLLPEPNAYKQVRLCDIDFIVDELAVRRDFQEWVLPDGEAGL